MKSDILIEIIKSYEEFEDSGQSGTKEFSRWFYEKNLQSKSILGEDELNRNISYLLQKVSRLSKYFGKNALKGMDLKSVDEFAILNTIFNNSGISKNELYKKAVFETTTGTQIVNRLVSKGLTEAYICEKDKRVTRLKLTLKGKNIRNLTFEALKEEVKFKVSSLDKEEKINFEKILRKLDLHLSTSFEKESN